MLNVFISIAYWERLISGVCLSIVVPQAIGISLHNRIGNSAGDVPCFYLGVSIGTMGLILLICSLFLSVSVSHFIVCFSIDTPLYWYGLDLLLPLPSLYTWVFGQKSRTYADFWPKIAYIHSCSLYSRVHPPFW